MQGENCFEGHTRIWGLQFYNFSQTFRFIRFKSSYENKKEIKKKKKVIVINNTLFVSNIKLNLFNFRVKSKKGLQCSLSRESAECVVKEKFSPHK